MRCREDEITEMKRTQQVLWGRVNLCNISGYYTFRSINQQSVMFISELLLLLAFVLVLPYPSNGKMHSALCNINGTRFICGIGSSTAFPKDRLG